MQSKNQMRPALPVDQELSHPSYSQNLDQLIAFERHGKTRLIPIIFSLWFIFISTACVQKTKNEAKEATNVKVTDTKHGQITMQEPPVSDEEVVTASPVTQGEDLKIGILVGPGGARTWAAIGVLREFEKANISVHAIGGMEWGSFISALFSQKGKTNDTEWRASKIEDGAFKNGILSRSFNNRYESKNLKDFQDDLKTIFEDQRAENSKIKFVCGTDSYKVGKSSMLNKGLLTDVMNYCLSYPPLLETYKGWNASGMRIKPYVDALKSLGANYLILIDVVPGGNPLSGQSVSSEASILWMEVQKSLKSDYKLFNQVIEVRLNQPITDFRARKTHILDGEKMGKQAVQTLKDHL